MSIVIDGMVMKCPKCKYDIRQSMTKGFYCPNMQCEKNPYYGKVKQ